MLLSSARAALFATLTLLPGCSRELGDRECGELLDRYVTLLVSSDRQDVNETDVLKLKAHARDKAARDPAFGACSERVSRRQFDCAMRADHVDRLEQCLL